MATHLRRTFFKQRVLPSPKPVRYAGFPEEPDPLSLTRTPLTPTLEKALPSITTPPGPDIDEMLESSEEAQPKLTAGVVLRALRTAALSLRGASLAAVETAISKLAPLVLIEDSGGELSYEQQGLVETIWTGLLREARRMALEGVTIRPSATELLREIRDRILFSPPARANRLRAVGQKVLELSEREASVGLDPDEGEAVLELERMAREGGTPLKSAPKLIKRPNERGKAKIPRYPRFDGLTARKTAERLASYYSTEFGPRVSLGEFYRRLGAKRDELGFQGSFADFVNSARLPRARMEDVTEGPRPDDDLSAGITEVFGIPNQ